MRDDESGETESGIGGRSDEVGAESSGPDVEWLRIVKVGVAVGEGREARKLWGMSRAEADEELKRGGEDDWEKWVGVVGFREDIDAEVVLWRARLGWGFRVLRLDVGWNLAEVAMGLDLVEFRSILDWFEVKSKEIRSNGRCCE